MLSCGRNGHGQLGHGGRANLVVRTCSEFKKVDIVVLGGMGVDEGSDGSVGGDGGEAGEVTMQASTNVNS